MPMCWASSPMDRPSSPRVVARLAAASRIARRLSAPSARGFRLGPGSPSDRLDPSPLLLVLDIPARFPRLINRWEILTRPLDIIARPFVLFKERPVVLLSYPSL